MELTEGRNRQVRRMGDAVGHRVLRLHRSRYAGLGLARLASRAMAPDHAGRVDPPRRAGGARALSGRVLRAVRGATSVREDTSEAIRERTAELLGEVLSRNALAADDLVSIIFTATEDLTADFPAVAAREIGLSAVPLLCTREIPVVGALGMCIRVMVHCYAPPERTIRHVYLHDARQLRMDLPE